MESSRRWTSVNDRDVMKECQSPTGKRDEGREEGSEEANWKSGLPDSNSTPTLGRR